jgi:hypothetical protein
MNRHHRYEEMLAARSMLMVQDREQLAAHLAVCSSCRQRAAVYDRQDEFLHILQTGALPRSVLPAVLSSPVLVARRPRRYGALSTLLSRDRAGQPGRTVGLAILAVLALAILSGAVYAAGSIIRVYHPGDRLSTLLWTPMLPPYQDVHYRTLDPARAARESGYAVAYLRTAPAGTGTSVGVDIVPHVGWPNQTSGPQPADPRLRGQAMAIRSVVRYRGSGHTVIVLLNEPSPAAIQTRELVLGDRTVHLPNGQEAFTSTGQSPGLSFIQPRSGRVNMIAWVQGHYVVSLWSDLSEAKLLRLASTAAIVQPKSNPSQRGIPSTWPTPLPLDRLPARLTAVVTGKATYRQQGTGLTIAYLFNFSSYSQGAVYGLDKWHNVSVTVVFPLALQRRSTDPIPHHTFSGGGFGTGGNITANVTGMGPGKMARAVRQGVTVRLAWTEHQQRRRQAFHFPLTPGSCRKASVVCTTPLPGR